MIRKTYGLQTVVGSKVEALAAALLHLAHLHLCFLLIQELLEAAQKQKIQHHFLFKAEPRGETRCSRFTGSRTCRLSMMTE